MHFTLWGSCEIDSIKSGNKLIFFLPRLVECSCAFSFVFFLNVKAEFSFIFIFNFSKKWLPQQLRKLSHSGKTDKLPVDKSVLKKEKEKDKKNKQEKQKEEPEAASSSISVRSTQQLTASIPHHQEEEDALECLELPPPMKPIQDASQIVGDDNCNQTTNSSGSKALDENDLAEIEQIVKEKMVNFLIFHGFFNFAIFFFIGKA